MISTHTYPSLHLSSAAIITSSPMIAISPMNATTSYPNLQTEITQSPLSILSKQSMIYGTTQQHVFNQTYNSEKMEPCQTKQTKLLEPKLVSNDINASNCYELFRFSLNNNSNTSKHRSPTTRNATSITTCYSSSTHPQHSIPNDLINLASMTPESFKSNHHTKTSMIRVQDMHSPVRTYYVPKLDHSPHLNAYHGASSPSLISRSKIIGVVSTSRSSSVTDIHRKSPSLGSESSSCKSPTRDDIPKAALSKIQKPKHQHANKKRSSSSSSTDEEEGKKFNTGTWTRVEHEQFLKGLEEVGKNWKLISENYVQTRKRTQIASHAQKWFLKLAEMKKGGDLSNSEELYL